MLKRLFMKVRAMKGRRRHFVMQPAHIAAMVQMVAATQPVEIGCDDCFEQLDRFAELTRAGQSAADVLPLVQQHLEHCIDCREEFEGLLAALTASVGTM